jgi:hypothetical protein
MGEPLHVPEKACGTCPYRRDTPSGVWSAEEYEKLREYDREFPPALAVFWCHQYNATGRPTVCRGWLSTHRDHPAVRLGLALGALNPEDVAGIGEESDTYYGTGTEACEAGLRDIENPSDAARKKVMDLIRRGAGRYEDEDEDDA